jgi:phosphatidylcholine synthase
MTVGFTLRLYNINMANMTPHSKPKMRAILAYGVHLFTATGAVFGFLALLAVIQHEWKLMIVWMVASMLVDGLDGFLARLADTKTYAAKFDGALMDNIIDYFTYVVVPALFLFESEVLPPGWGIIGASAILLASAFQFSQTDAKTDDHFFTGFPSYWNIVAIYALVLGLNPWVNLVILLLLVALVFIPIKYVYPTRSTYLRTLTLSLIAVYFVIGIWGLMSYPNIPTWMIWATVAFFGYYFGLSLWLTYKTRKK